MKVRTLFLVLLIVVVLFAVQWQFSSYSPGTTFVAPGGVDSVLVVAKENYVYARLQIQVQAFGPSPVMLTFPNGTKLQITGTEEFNIVLPNSVYYTFSSVGEAGAGFSVSTNEPFNVGFLTGQNASSALTFPPNGIQGIDAYEFILSGNALIQVSSMWVRL